ncbi:hypothetical protein [Mesorhizobium sp.]|uniref:hypothetical protein n=1 Tax=Mesorhizobium sp. TaxID=1871066 RepID=UPI0011F575CB|nr:hypothetical protein [Mesorhizobium sp.]TIO26931.1 MAG: hypothetical protein E5X83_06320 [Mesorhizobium sp.]
MADQMISFVQAVARVEIALPKVSDPGGLLNDAIDQGLVDVWVEQGEPTPVPLKGEIFRDAVNRYAGGMTYVDLEADEKVLAYLNPSVTVGLESLNRWLAGFLTVSDKSALDLPVITKSTLSNRHPEKMEAAITVLRTLAPNALTGKREALLAEVNGALVGQQKPIVSKKTLLRALKGMGQK